MNTQEIHTILSPYKTLTLIGLGGGAMGNTAVSKVWYVGSQGGYLAYKEKQRGRRMFKLCSLLQRIPLMVLKGHHDRPITESQMSHTFMIDGKAKLASPDGLDGLIDFMKENVLVHSLSNATRVFYVTVQPGDEASQRHTGLITERLLSVLPPSVLGGSAPVPPPPDRKSLLRDSDKKKLLAAYTSRRPDGFAKPIVKIFGSACTWLLCEMEPNEDTCWAYCDIGHGMVEFGTVSLMELETTRHSVLKIHFERDQWFDGKNIDASTLCDQTSLSGI